MPVLYPYYWFNTRIIGENSMNMTKRSTVNGVTVTFDPTYHTYRDNIGRKYTSVTSAAKRFEPPFDSDANATRVALRTGRTKDEILASWAEKGAESSLVGTRAHMIAESMFLDREIPSEDRPETDDQRKTYQMIQSAVTHLKSRWRFHIAEWLLFSPRYGIAGQCDLVMWQVDHARSNQATNDYYYVAHILDWKTCEKIEQENRYGQFFTGPLKHLPGTKFNKYALQLRTYERLIIESDTSFASDRVTINCAIIHVHHSLDKPRFIPVPRLDREVDIILADCAARFKNKSE